MRPDCPYIEAWSKAPGSAVTWVINVERVPVFRQVECVRPAEYAIHVGFEELEAILMSFQQLNGGEVPLFLRGLTRVLDVQGFKTTLPRPGRHLQSGD